MFINKMKRVYEHIEEFTIEANYEFVSEQDMIDAKWSEKLDLAILVHSLPNCAPMKGIVSLL